MTEGSHFGNQNSTLGSVVPLAMFFILALTLKIIMTKISIVLAAQKQAIGCRLQQIASPIGKKQGKFQCHRLLINTSDINRHH